MFAISMLTQFVLGTAVSAAPLGQTLDQGRIGERVIVSVRMGENTLPLAGKIVLSSPPGLPEFFGLLDDHSVLHLLKADPELVSVSKADVDSVAPSPRVEPLNHLLTSWKDFSNVHDDLEGSQRYLREHGYGEMIDRDVVALSKHKKMVQFLSWGGSTVGVMLYFSFLDSAGAIYLGRVGPRVIMDHFSNMAGSFALVSQGFVFGPKTRVMNRVWRIFLATGATAANYAVENPFGLETTRMFTRYNVQDPKDFLAGVTVAWLAAISPEVMKLYDQVRGKVRRYVQSARCESLLSNGG